jgi:Na+-transporting NADH:ubiquinone oxidoreductase subunit NqrB
MELNKFISKDARDLQLMFLSVFMLYGVIMLRWEISYTKIVLTQGICILTQILGSRIIDKNWKWDSVKSASITAFGLAILFYSESDWVIALSAFLAIISKFIFRYKGFHFLNPSNAGIILTLILTGKGWVSPGQWGTLSFITFFILGFGLLIVTKSGRLDSALSYLIVALLLDYFRMIVYQGWDLTVLLHKYTNGSLILFTFFMITDPRSTPQNRYARIIWSIFIVISTYFLTYKLQIYTAPLWALFYCSFLTPLFNYLLPGENFEWNQTFKNKLV